MERLRCWLFGHRFVIEWEPMPGVRKLWCRRCHRHFGMNDHAQVILPWDDELEELHRWLAGR